MEVKAGAHNNLELEFVFFVGGGAWGGKRILIQDYINFFKTYVPEPTSYSH